MWRPVEKVRTFSIDDHLYKATATMLDEQTVRYFVRRTHAQNHTSSKVLDRTATMDIRSDRLPLTLSAELLRIERSIKGVARRKLMLASTRPESAIPTAVPA